MTHSKSLGSESARTRLQARSALCLISCPLPVREVVRPSQKVPWCGPGLQVTAVLTSGLVIQRGKELSCALEGVSCILGLCPRRPGAPCPSTSRVVSGLCQNSVESH